jgi:nucleotide-binding universal stress UspA family protein
MIRNQLLLAIDQFEAGEAAVDFTIGLTSLSDAHVTVFHVRELSPMLRVPPIETIDEASDMVQQSVTRILRAGISADGLICTAREDAVARSIVAAAGEQWCNGIVLGSTRLRGIRRLAGRGVRERVMRVSPLPVFVAPPALRSGRQGWSTLLSHAAGNGTER